jgi:hypothetical protein
MDKYRKALLGAAGLIALTASGQKPADAAVPPDEANKILEKAAAVSAGHQAYGDPLFELMARTKGSFEQSAVDSALTEMLANPSPEQVEQIPNLIAGLSGLGASSDVVAKSRNLLVQLVSNAANISDDVKEATLTELQQEQADTFQPAQAGTFKLAQDDEALRRRKKLEEGQVGQTGGASSDIRVKHDISLVRRLDNGLGLYRFSYIGSNDSYVGVMAQEVEKVMPEAVVVGDDGYLRVHYDMLGIRMQSWQDWVASGQPIPTTKH